MTFWLCRLFLVAYSVNGMVLVEDCYYDWICYCKSLSDIIIINKIMKEVFVKKQDWKLIKNQRSNQYRIIFTNNGTQFYTTQKRLITSLLEESEKVIETVETNTTRKMDKRNNEHVHCKGMDSWHWFPIFIVSYRWQKLNR